MVPFNSSSKLSRDPSVCELVDVCQNAACNFLEGLSACGWAENRNECYSKTRQHHLPSPQAAHPKAQNKHDSMFSLSVLLHKHTSKIFVHSTCPFPSFFYFLAVSSLSCLLLFYWDCSWCWKGGSMVGSTSCLSVEHHAEAQLSLAHHHLEFHNKSRPFLCQGIFTPSFCLKC